MLLRGAIIGRNVAILLCGANVAVWRCAPVRKMRTTAEQSALTRSQASLQPRFAWLSKVARRGDKSNVISKNFFRYCVGCEDLYGAWSFGFLRK